MNYDSREKIIETTSALLRTYGYKAVSVNQIIRESGTSKGSFYYHFPNGKEDVVVEVLRGGYAKSVGGTQAILAQYDDLKEAFSHLLNLMIADIDNGHAEDLIFSNLSVIAIEASNDSPVVVEECAKIYEALRKVFSDKVYSSGFYTEEVARYLGVMLQTTFGGAIVASFSSKTSDALVTLRDGLAWTFDLGREHYLATAAK